MPRFWVDDGFSDHPKLLALQARPSWQRALALWHGAVSIDDQADRTAAHLLELYRACGSWDGALSAYQSGICSSDSGVRYAGRVMRRAGTL